MRPLSLTMSAFGPFAGREQIDFQALGEQPLFLINGATGAGKTTILDAICFALYGGTTGNEREASQMRCDQAAAELITEVELLFELRTIRYRVVRQPEQQKPKKKGEGYTLHRPRAELYQLDQDGTERLIVAAKVSEATLAIEELTGLSAEQFRQVMVLPQGEFRRLLLAKSSDREKVFGQLFQTHIYQRIEEALKQQAGDLKQRTSALKEQRAGILDAAGLAQAAELECEQQQLNPRWQAASEDLQCAKQALLKSQQQLQQVRAVVEQQRQLQQARERLQQLQQRAPEQHRRQQQLQCAANALQIQGHWQAADIARRNLTARIDEQRRAAAQLEQHRQQAVEADSALAATDDCLAAVEQLQQQLTQLTGWVQRLKQLRDAQQTLDHSGQQQQRQQQCVEQLQQQLQQQQQRQERERIALAALAADLSQLPAIELQLVQVNQRLQLSQQLQQLVQQSEAAAQRRLKYTDAVKRAEQALAESERDSAQLQLAWHRGQASILAASLEHGLPCSVCGSVQHPDPASGGDDIPSPQQRDHAQAVIDDRRQQLGSHRSQLAGIESEQQQLEQQLQSHRQQLRHSGAESSEAAITAEQQRLISRQNELLERQLQHQQGLAAQQQGEELCQRLAVDFQQQQTQLAADNTAKQLAQQAVITAEAEVPAPYREPGALQSETKTARLALEQQQQRRQQAQTLQHQAHLQQESSRSAAHYSAQQQLQAEQAASTADQQWQHSLSDSAFDSVEHFLASQLEQAQHQQLTAEHDDYRRQYSESSAVVEQLTQALAEHPAADVEALSEQCRQQEIQHTSLHSHFAELDQRRRLLTTVAQRLAKAAESAAVIEQQFAVVGTLSEVASGRNNGRISLQRFVLSALLDDVLVVASERLSAMSRGRYTLYRLQQRGKGNAASGLELIVEDAYSGKRRPVATLSGGESFMAALSLALGLSDVAQSYAGGISLDTLFIDEGFGSLDSESLDLAIDTLVGLQQSGRMVGIISHVPELKERIATRLDIFSDQRGSRVSVVR